MAAVGLVAVVAGQARPMPGSRPEAYASQAAGGQEGCKAYFTVEPLDANALKLLSTPVVPQFQTAFTDAQVRRIQKWDLPSEVISWKGRPSAEDLARQWGELNKAGGQDKSGKDAPAVRYRPYGLRALSAEQWTDMRDWFEKNGPKKVPGMCVDSEKATYVLAIGVVSTKGSATNDPNRAIEYSEYAGAPQRENIGANVETLSHGGHTSAHDALANREGSGDPSAYTCAYLYRTNGATTGQGGVRQATPVYYYCRGGGVAPQSAVTAMLKHLSKTSLP
jgi:hypothetical protein